MPPKTRKKPPKIKQEETDEPQIITKSINLFPNTNLSSIIKIEKEELTLIQENIPTQQSTFIEELSIKQEEPLDIIDTLEPEEDEKTEITAYEPKDSKKFTCKACNATFSTKSALTKHKKLHTDPMKCKKCSKVFKIKKNFDTHKCTYECKICQKSFFRNDNLTQHMNYVHGNWKKSELYTCDCCAKGFKYKKSLACHMKQHMEEKPLICKICNEGFSVSNTFKQHMLTHAGKVPCKVCGKRLKPSAIYYHMRQAHETSKNFHCTICEASFKTKGDLNTHYGTHDKKHQCSICEKKFSRSYKLKIHFQIHVNPKMFECKKCFKALARKETLEQHEKWCGETFCCGNCDFVTNFPKRLLTHEAKCIKKEKVKRIRSFKDFEESSSEDDEDDDKVKEEKIDNELFCNHCKKEFNSKEELMEHIRNIIL